MNRKITPLLLPILIICLWQLSFYLHFISPLFLPSFFKVIGKLISDLISGAILNDIYATLLRLFVGFSIAVVVGVPLGICMGSSSKMYRVFHGLLDFFRGIPSSALFPLFILFFGIGNGAKYAITAWGASLVIVLNSMYGVHLAREMYMKVAKLCKVRGVELAFKVILPSALPQIFVGFRTAISLSLILVIVSEMFVGTNVGLGALIFNSQMMYRTEEMYSVIIITGVIGYILNKLLLLIEKTTIHWKGK